MTDSQPSEIKADTEPRILPPSTQELLQALESLATHVEVSCGCFLPSHEPHCPAKPARHLLRQNEIAAHLAEAHASGAYEAVEHERDNLDVWDKENLFVDLGLETYEPEQTVVFVDAQENPALQEAIADAVVAAMEAPGGRMNAEEAGAWFDKTFPSNEFEDD